MDKSDFWEKFSQWCGCGCYLIPVVLIVGSIVIGLLNRGDVEAAKQAEHIRDSIERVEKLDSIKIEIEVMDMINKVIFREGDSLYHYYINCYRMHVPGRLKVMKRNMAKKNGMKPCPDCMELEDHYLDENGYYERSEKSLRLHEKMYSD